MNCSKGFTLAEIAIVLVIVSLLLVGAMIPLSTQIEVRNLADTRRTVDVIKDAMIGFAQANGRLPCPANGALAAAVAGAGLEQYDAVTTKSCTSALGVVPWATLGVPETDAWGHRFTYRVSPAFADDSSLNTWQSRKNSIDPATFPSQSTTAILSPDNQSPTCPSSSAPAVAPYLLFPMPVLSSFALCTLGDITVLTRSEADHSVVTPLGAALPAVFVSHGKNGYGAYTPSGGARLPGGSGDEAANANGGTTATPSGGYLSHALYSRNPTPSATDCSDTTGTVFCEFDDIVAWISPSILVSRMVSAGKLP